MTDEQIDDWMFKNAEWTEQLGSAVPADKVRALLAESAPTPKPASPETLSDAELLAHFQKSPANPSDKQEAVRIDAQIDELASKWFMNCNRLTQNQWRGFAIDVARIVRSTPSDKQEAVNLQVFAEKVRNGIADYIADNMPDKKHSLAEIDLYVRRIEINAGMIAAPFAQSAEQDRIDAERYRRARDADYIVDSTERAIDNWIKGASK